MSAKRPGWCRDGVTALRLFDVTGATPRGLLVILSKFLYYERMTEQRLGEYLRSVRKAAGFTLRRVEELSSGRVKNGYLSQVESGAIRVPSTRVLLELSNIYKVEYDGLLRLAGLPTSADAGQLSEARIASFPVAAIEDLNEAETAELMKFVAFLKSRRKN